MSSATAPSTLVTAIQEVATNATVAEREHFQALWQYTLVLLRQGIIGYFLPRSMAIKVGYGALRDIAKKLSDAVETDIYISFEVDESAYYIGQIFDETYLRRLFETTSIHRIQFQKSKRLLLQLNPDDGFSVSITGLSTSSTWSAVAPKIPKPRNMWIIYRQDKHSFILEVNPGMHTSKISTVISAMWKNECVEVREYYKKLADEEKASHQLQHPDYKCSPRKASEIKKRKRVTEDEEEARHLNISSHPPATVRYRTPQVTGTENPSQSVVTLQLANYTNN